MSYIWLNWKIPYDRNLAHEITRAEAEGIVKQAEDAGLVHTTNNSQDRLNFVCNCCSCCCTVLRGLTELKNPNAFAKSRCYAEVDSNLCVGCGICEDERCPVNAITVNENVARVARTHCIGCGLCATTCTEEAISMLPREQAPKSPATVSEM
ncbi:MAG: 4Fe-4S dicluster domain-containing protein, partial [Candidatus Hodarchaeota archaeon]